MNRLHVEVKALKRVEKLNIVAFKYANELLSMMSLELDEKVKVGSRVSIGFKSMAVGVAKGFSGALSYSNQLPCTIVSIEKGELLSELRLSCHGAKIDSIITTASLERMRLEAGESVTALVKASEIYIEEIL